MRGRFDWAFCTPVDSEASPGWALYVAGRFGGATPTTLLAPWETNELRDDVKFAELVAKILGALRQVRAVPRTANGLPPVLLARRDELALRD